MPRGLGLLGQKVGMTQVFDKAGRAVGSTVILAGPFTVTRVKSAETDGYQAVQMAFREEPKAVRMGKPVAGMYAKAGLPVHRILAEFLPPLVAGGSSSGTRVAWRDDLTVGTQLTVTLFKPGDRVDVQGTSKGRGFQGVVKRHGFHGGPDTHGSRHHRAPGSIGASTDPGHTFRGTRMPGRLGNRTATSQNLEVLQIDGERHLLVVKGAVPGATGSWMKILPSVKHKAPTAWRLTAASSGVKGGKTAAKTAAKTPRAKKS